MNDRADVAGRFTIMQGYGPPPSMRQEVPILTEPGLQVTTARFVVGHQTYPVAAITTVSPFTVPAQKSGPIGAAVLGGLGSAAALAGLISAEPGKSGGLGVMWLLSMVAFFWGLYHALTRKPVHVVMVSTSGMQVRALASADLALIHRVVGALNQAIASR